MINRPKEPSQTMQAATRCTPVVGRARRCLQVAAAEAGALRPWVSRSWSANPTVETERTDKSRAATFGPKTSKNAKPVSASARQACACVDQA